MLELKIFTESIWTMLRREKAVFGKEDINDLKVDKKNFFGIGKRNQTTIIKSEIEKLPSIYPSPLFDCSNKTQLSFSKDLENGKYWLKSYHNGNKIL